MESMLGFRQDLGMAGSVQSVAAFSVEPEVEGAGGQAGDQGLDEASVRSFETMQVGPDIDAEVGSTAVIGRLGGNSPSTATAVLPYANVEFQHGDKFVRYRMATMMQDQDRSQDRNGDESETAAWLPAMSMRNGALTIQHGVHQEIGWERQTDASDLAVMVYSDRVYNPVLQALGHFAATGSAADAAGLFDPASNLMRVAGPAFSSAGMQASVARRLPGNNRLRVSYASGAALVMTALPPATPLAEVVAAAHPRRAQMYSISLSGTLDGTGTRWRASYRWQPVDTVTEIAPFAEDAASPYLNLRVSQPIHVTRDGSGGLEALLDVRNLLAEGYRPYILSDGSLLLFADDQRSLSAGLAFTF
jgi:hypothetical protein